MMGTSMTIGSIRRSRLEENKRSALPATIRFVAGATRKVQAMAIAVAIGTVKPFALTERSQACPSHTWRIADLVTENS